MKVLHTFIALVCIGLLCAINVKAQNPTYSWSSPTLTITINDDDDVIIPSAVIGAVVTITLLQSVVIIPQGFTYSIAAYAFTGCTGLTSVTLPAGLTNVGDNAFQNCDLLTSIIFPGNVGNIGSSAFMGCSELTSITFNGSVGNIAFNAFRNCNLSAITIPASVTNIGSNAFMGNTSLTKVTFERTTDPSVATALTIATANPFGTAITHICIPTATHKDAWVTLLAGKGMGDASAVESKIDACIPLPRPPRKPGDVRIGGSVNVGKGSTLNIGKP